MAALGIRSPTAIQRESIQVLLQGEHAAIEGYTGSGKTLAYLLPILQQLETKTGGKTEREGESAKEEEEEEEEGRGERGVEGGGAVPVRAETERGGIDEGAGI